MIGGLDDDVAHALLEAVVAGPLDERVRDRIVRETRGNPLALLELPRGRTPAELAGGFGLGGGPALSGRIEERFQERLAELPPSTPASGCGARIAASTPASSSAQPTRCSPTSA